VLSGPLNKYKNIFFPSKKFFPLLIHTVIDKRLGPRVCSVRVFKEKFNEIKKKKKAHPTEGGAAGVMMTGHFAGAH
jgi:hypothetical protein